MAFPVAALNNQRHRRRYRYVASVPYSGETVNLRHIRRSVTVPSAATLHTSVTSRVDYCNAVFTDKLRRVLNAAALVDSGMGGSSTAASESGYMLARRSVSFRVKC